MAINFYDSKLSYVSQEANNIPPVLQQLYGDKAISLDFSYNSLTSLHGLSSFKNLEILVLDNNNLNDSSLDFPLTPSLHTLSINNNKLTDLPRFLNKVKTNFPALRHLSVLGNPMCPNPFSHLDKDESDYQKYRYYVIHQIPNLNFLDSSLIKEDEWTEGMIRGRYMNIVRPTYKQEKLSPEQKSKYSPLPRNGTRKTGGLYVKRTHKYSGKHSEGNKFIRNHEL